MSKLLDTTNKVIRFMSYDLIAGQVSEPVVVRVIAGDAMLVSEQSDDVMLKAREHGTADPFVDLADGIDLSGFTPGSNVDFDLICEASEDVVGLVRAALFLGVVTSGPAAWAA